MFLPNPPFFFVITTTFFALFNFKLLLNLLLPFNSVDATGEYTIYVDQDRADEVCDVKLINSPERSCSERAPGHDQARVILTRYNGIASNDRFANAMLYMAEEVASGCVEVLKQMQELDEEN